MEGGHGFFNHERHKIRNAGDADDADGSGLSSPKIAEPHHLPALLDELEIGIGNETLAWPECCNGRFHIRRAFYADWAGQAS